MRNAIRFATALACAPFASASLRSQPALSQGAASRASLQAAILSLSGRTARGDVVAALTAALNDSATLVWDGAPIARGRAAAERAMRAQAGIASVCVQLVPQLVELSDDGTFGVSWGVLLVHDAAHADAPARAGRYLSAWRRDTNGAWSISVFAPLLPLTAEPYVPPATLASLPLAIDVRGRPFAAADSLFAAMAATQGAPRAFGASAAPDAVTFPGDGLAVGPSNIEQRMAASGAGRLRWEWRPRVADGARDGSLGFTVGEATIRAPAPDTTSPPLYSKYLSLWRRQRDGSIRFLSDGGNGRPEATAR